MFKLLCAKKAKIMLYFNFILYTLYSTKASEMLVKLGIFAYSASLK